jgi:hypothetical protein
MCHLIQEIQTTQLTIEDIIMVPFTLLAVFLLVEFRGYSFQYCMTNGLVHLLQDFMFSILVSYRS